MECRELSERTIDVLAGESTRESERELSEHLGQCASCPGEHAAIERTWSALGEDPEPVPSPSFRLRARALIEEEMIRRRVREFRPKRRWARPAAAAAALLVAAAGGYFAARTVPPARPESAVLAGGTLPDLEGNPRLSNVSARPAAAGRLAIEFDATTRHTVVGSPREKEVARLLAYLLSRNAETAGEKSRAIDLVSEHYGAGVAPASPDVVAALTETLRSDSNPGVRKKAADALAGFRSTPEIRTAFLEALRRDPNPAVRLVAIERLAADAREAPDARTIDSLRERAFDPAENGFVRARAASALRTIDF